MALNLDNDFLIKIGIEPDNAQNQKAIEQVLEEVRKALNKEFGFNIEVGNLNEIIKKVQELGDGFRVIKNSSGDITSVSTNFKSVSGAIVTLNTNLNQTITTLKELKQISNSFQKDLGAAFRAGNLYDAEGNQIQKWNDRGKADYISETSAQTTTVYKNNPTYILNEIIDRYKIIKKLQNEMSGSGWSEVFDRLQKVNNELEEYIENQRKNKTVNEKELNSTVARNEYDLGDQAYKQILKIQEQITQSKRKEIDADSKNINIIKQKTSQLNSQLEAIKSIAKLTEQQQKGVRNAQASSIQQVADYAEIKRQISLEEKLTQNYKKQIEYIKQIDNLNSKNTDSNELTYAKEQLRIRQEESAVIKGQITDQKKLNDIQSSFDKQRKEQQIKVSDAEDTAKVEKAIKLKQELAKAETDLFKAQKQRAGTETLSEQQDVVNRLTSELKKATDAQMSNGQAVNQSERYRRAANEADEKAVTIQTQLEKRYKGNTITLGKLVDQLKETANNVVQYNLAWDAFNKVDDIIVDSVAKVKELDDAMTQIRLVTGESGESARETMNSYAELAKELGTTTQVVSEGSIEWLRQGRTAEETTELLRASTMLSQLGAIESSEATEKLTAIMNGYKLSVSDAMDVVDKLAKVDLIAATSTEELSTALQYVSSYAEASGLSLDRMIGYIASVSETTRLSAETIGQGWKSILSRIQNVKAGKSIDDMGESINDTEKVLTRFGISLRDNAKEFRNIGDIIDDVAARWDDFTSVEQNQIATAMAGTYQRNTFIATMENYGKAMKYAQEAQESAGTSEEKYGVVLDSIQGKINQFIATWEQMINRMGQGDTFKFIVDSGTTLLSKLDYLINDLGVIQNFVFPVGIAFGFKQATQGAMALLSNIKNLKNELSGLSGLIGQATTISGGSISKADTSSIVTAFNQLGKLDLGKFNDEFSAWAAAIKPVNTQVQATVLQSKGLNAQQTVLTMSTQGLTADVIANSMAYAGYSKEAITASLSANNFSKEQIEAAISTKAFDTALKTTAVSTGGLTKAVNLFKAAWATSPFMVIGAIFTAIQVGVAIFDHFNVTLEEHREKVEELNKQYKDTVSQLESIKNELEENEKQLREINSMESLDIIEQKQLSDLKAANRELKIQQALLESISSSELKNAIEESTKLMGKVFDIDGSFAETYAKEQQDYALSEQMGNSLTYTLTAIDDNNAIKLLQVVEGYQEKIAKNQEEYQKALAEGNTEEINRLQTEYETFSNAYKESQSALVDFYKENETVINETISQVNDALSQGIKISADDQAAADVAKKMQELILKALDPTAYTQLRVGDLINTDGALDKLQALTSELDEEEISAEEYAKKVNSIFEDLYNNDELREQLIGEGLIKDEDYTDLDTFKAKIESIVGEDYKVNIELELPEVEPMTFQTAAATFATEIAKIKEQMDLLDLAMDEFNETGGFSVEFNSIFRLVIWKFKSFNRRVK